MMRLLSPKMNISEEYGAFMQHYSPISQLRDNILTALARTPESTPYCTLLLSSFVFFRRLLLTGGKRRRRTSQASEFVMQVREERRGQRK